MKAALSKEERETIITFDETPADATIFTYNKNWQSHLEKRLGLKPTGNNGLGGREYQVPKNRIKPPRAPKKVSEKTKRRLREQAQTRRQKSPNPPRNNTVASKSRGKNSSEGKNINRKTHQQKNQENLAQKLL